MRIRNTIKNALIGTTLQVITMLIGFITRGVFARVLAVEYLGVDSVFTDIIGMLSIAEMGFSTAITYSLYKPISEKNYSKINSIMKLYKKVYERIGLLIIIIGLIITPLIELIIGNILTIDENIYFVFMMYLLNSAIGYFFSYKQTLIIANQQNYIVEGTTKSLTIISNIIQIFMLIKYRNFVIYIVIKILNILLINVFLSRKANKLYPYLDINNAGKINKLELLNIKKNIMAMFFHKIGEKIVFGTDNIFISVFSSVVASGMYSNYYLVTVSLSYLLDIFLNASAASVGDMNVKESKEKSEYIFQQMFFLNFVLYGFSSSVLLAVFSDFILLWVGQKYMLSIFSMGLIVLNFYIHGMRRTVIIFRDSWGLFYKDRYKPFFEIFVNIVSQIFLGSIWGLNGILIGTSLTILLTSFWIEPYVLYKYGFNMKVKNFFKEYIRYTLKMIFVIIVTYYILSVFLFDGLSGFIFKLMLSSVITFILMLIVLFNESSVKYYVNMLKKFKA